MFESVQHLLAEVVACGSAEPERSAEVPDPAGSRAGRDDGRPGAVAAVEPPVAAPPSQGLSTREMIDRIAAAERLVHAVQAAQRRDVAEFARARLAADDACAGVGTRLHGRTVGTELGLALAVSPTVGASRASLAAICTEDHPVLSALADAGRVSEYALRSVTQETEVLTSEHRRVVDAQLGHEVATAPEGDRFTAGRLRQAAARRVIAVDPHAATRRCERARSDRAFGVMDRRDGTATLWARLRAEEALAVHQVIDGQARRMRVGGDDRSLADLRCDLLVEATTGVSADECVDASVTAAGPVTGSAAPPTASAGPPRSSTADPSTADPSTADPSTTDPSTTDPSTVDPSTEGPPTEGPPAEGPSTGEPLTIDRTIAPPLGAGELLAGDLAVDDPAWDTYPTTEPTEPMAPTEPTGPSTPHGASAAAAARRPRVPARVELQVVMAASTLLGLDEDPAMLRGYGAIPADVARQIIDAANDADAADIQRAPGEQRDGPDGTDVFAGSRGRGGGGSSALRPPTKRDGAGPGGVFVRRLLCDPIDGRLIGMDTKTRCYVGPVRQFTTWREQVCRVAETPIVDIDHLRRHTDGGPTSVGNGQGLAKNTHVLRDHPGVRVRTVPPAHARTAPGQSTADPPGAADPIDQTGDRADQTAGPAERAERLQQMHALRSMAPDVEWTLPTGHGYTRRPPPALGWGSTPTPVDPPPPPDAETAARTQSQAARILRRELASMRRRLRQRERRRRKRRRSTLHRVLTREARHEHRQHLRFVREYAYQEWTDDTEPTICLDLTRYRHAPQTRTAALVTPTTAPAAVGRRSRPRECVPRPARRRITGRGPAPAPAPP